ncbi:hypothetical protein B0H11DRAFT_1374053 [Mycena galericulata]|nr:hypothetical protein B0H11DRAFT_1374053 [Mycena galericulata]
MSIANPYPQQNNPSFPALHLYPLDDSFVPKRIALGGGNRVKIARPPNTKTLPGERNGYFDSRVLSRQHAEVWEEGNKIFIKDVKSSNGTFINGERLSLEGRESEPYELKSDDILEFGVDIVSEDNKTVLHRKVVARVTCVFPSKYQPQQGQPLPQDQFATMSPGGVSFNGMGMGAPRRPQVPMIHQGLAGLGGMGGGGVRAPGRGLTLDHIFSRLQAELAKSRDTGHDLQVLTGALGNIEDTLNGALPPTTAPPAFPDVLPGVRPPRPLSVPALPQVPPVAGSPPPVDVVAELQAQLREHQASLRVHMDGIRALEGVLSEQEAMKREVRELREFVGVDRQVAAEEARGSGAEEESEEEEGADDDDDARSVMTVIPHELERVEEEQEEELEEVSLQDPESEAPPSAQQDADALREEQEREENFTRQRAQTPEPILEELSSDLNPSAPRSPPRTVQEIAEATVESQTDTAQSQSATAVSLEELSARLALLAAQLEAALEASSALQAQHASAQATIVALEEKLAALEARAAVPVPLPEPLPAPAPIVAPAPAPAPIIVPAAVASAELEDLQAQLAAMRTELAAERGQREAWEERMRLAGANGSVAEKAWSLRTRRRRSASSGGSVGESASAGSVLEEEEADEQRELGLELDARRPKIETDVLSLAAVSPGNGVIDSEKSLRGTAPPYLNVQTALGVLILGIAAAAVLWRVKPQ